MDSVLVSRPTVMVLEVVLNCTCEPTLLSRALLLGRAAGGSQRREAHERALFLIRLTCLVCQELQLPMLKVSAPEMVSGVSGESEQKLRELFDLAVVRLALILWVHPSF